MSRQLRRDGHIQTLVHTRFNEMIRLSGVATEAQDSKAQIEQIFEEHPMLKNVYPGDTAFSAGTIFNVGEISIEYFNLATHPIERYQFEVSAKPKPKGFFITDECIACGTCIENCPQQCIIEGDIMQIDQVHCLHCGNCENVCPAGAVERL